MPRSLEPMSAADRKVVHDAVDGTEGVQTLSEGRRSPPLRGDCPFWESKRAKSCVTDSRYEALEAVWEPARATGSLGSVSIEELREHAAGYISPSLRLQPGARCVDLGTGVGIPGVLLAMLYPETTWYLLDGECPAMRDCAWEAVRAAGLGDRVEVVHETS